MQGVTKIYIGQKKMQTNLQSISTNEPNVISQIAKFVDNEEIRVNPDLPTGVKEKPECHKICTLALRLMI